MPSLRIRPPTHPQQPGSLKNSALAPPTTLPPQSTNSLDRDREDATVAVDEVAETSPPPLAADDAAGPRSPSPCWCALRGSAGQGGLGPAQLPAGRPAGGRRYNVPRSRDRCGTRRATPRSWRRVAAPALYLPRGLPRPERGSAESAESAVRTSRRAGLQRRRRRTATETEGRESRRTWRRTPLKRLLRRWSVPNVLLVQLNVGNNEPCSRRG